VTYRREGRILGNIPKWLEDQRRGEPENAGRYGRGQRNLKVEDLNAKLTNTDSEDEEESPLTEQDPEFHTPVETPTRERSPSLPSTPQIFPQISSRRFTIYRQS